MIVDLCKDDMDAILALERVAFPLALQASPSRYEKRFAQGHIMLGYKDEDLKGIISFSYGVFDMQYPSTIPDCFSDWSTQATPIRFDTVFIYNLGVDPEVRGTSVVPQLVRAALARAKKDGCHQALAEGPIPSYFGSGQVRENPAIRRALDSFALGGPMPSEDLLFEDPHLYFYRKLCRCSIVTVKKDFLLEDTESGGFRAFLHSQL